MNASRKLMTRAMVGAFAVGLCMLSAGSICQARAAAPFDGPSTVDSNDGNSTAAVNSPEPTTTAVATTAVATTNSGDASSAASASALPPALPPQAAPDSDAGWHLALSPYAWLPGMNGTAGKSGYYAGVHISPADFFRAANVGILALADIRYNRIVMPIDFLWAKLSDNRGIPLNEPGITSVGVKLNEDIFTPKIGYRLIDNKRIKVDGLAGFRYWHMGTTFTLTPPLANGLYRQLNWVDGVAGARITAPLTPKVEVTIAGDAGAGGANLDYQVLGAIGYKLKKATLQIGWRYIHVNYRPDTSFVMDVNMTGLIAGVTIPLK